jgi:hypothetical protein
MTGAQVAAAASFIGAAGTVIAANGGVQHNGHMVGAGGVLVLYALVLAVLSLRDR